MFPLAGTLGVFPCPCAPGCLVVAERRTGVLKDPKVGHVRPGWGSRLLQQALPDLVDQHVVVFLASPRTEGVLVEFHGLVCLDAQLADLLSDPGSS